MGVSDSEIEASLHIIEFLAAVVGLKINVGKTNNMCDMQKTRSQFTFAQKNVEFLRESHKSRVGPVIEAKNQSRLLIGTEVLVGKKKNVGWFETLAGEKLMLKNLAVAELVTLSSKERSVVADLVSTASNRSSEVVADESCVCSG